MLEDNSGGASTMRAIVLIWVITMCFNLTYGTITKQPFTIDNNLMTMTIGIVGAKAVQRFGEKATEA